MIHPEKILTSNIQNNIWQADCQTGSIRITPYGKHILHFAYYPDQPISSPMWGIEGEPDPEIPVSCNETGNTVALTYPEFSVNVNKSDSSMIFRRADGTALVSLLEYTLESAQVLGENTYRVKTVFSAEENETFYGLGQHQDGRLDLGGREQIMWHDYSHKGGEIVAVPFLISGKKYGILLDNPSRSRVYPGISGKTVWEAEVGECVSFFLLAGRETDDLYRSYRSLCGTTPLPPRRGLGFIQCKQRYASQEELMEVAKTYKAKGYPCDIYVVDWFHWKTLGDMSVDPAFWPDSIEMNRQLNEMGYETMISCWPRFMKESQYYDLLEEKGWFMKDAEGNTVYGTPEDQRGALIDTTNPECGAWYFDTVKQNYADLGYKYWWTDEDEPDISPHESFLYAGTGARVHNIYPLTHTKCIYEGHRKHLPHRCLTLSRAAWTGAQQYGTTFWSSDIFPEWDVLKRQIPTALNFCASGMPYWSSDIGGWQALPDEESEEDYSSLLLSTKSEGKGAVTKKNYTELYIRWFQFGVFCPTFRTHGTRKYNEVWSYGEETEKILVKYLKLRYRLMPYIYSLAHQVTETGAPFMRALWMDFEDKNCAEMDDEFLFGPAMLIAPIVEQGAVSRDVYLPAGCKWYDFYTNEVLEGGQTIHVEAPIDTIPVYVKAGSIIPMGEEVENMGKAQTQIDVCVYPGEDASFLLYSDDGQTYDYENGDYTLVELSWNEADQKFTVKKLNHSDKVAEMQLTSCIVK